MLRLKNSVIIALIFVLFFIVSVQSFAQILLDIRSGERNTLGDNTYSNYILGLTHEQLFFEAFYTSINNCYEVLSIGGGFETNVIDQTHVYPLYHHP